MIFLNSQLSWTFELVFRNETYMNLCLIYFYIQIIIRLYCLHIAVCHMNFWIMYEKLKLILVNKYYLAVRPSWSEWRGFKTLRNRGVWELNWETMFRSWPEKMEKRWIGLVTNSTRKEQNATKLLYTPFDSVMSFKHLKLYKLYKHT